ncbi:hypothetical protein PR048_031351 [Dryococelus australis]|uniref:Uncharacterized protein n=1 Tax=Dryococelus australis TaxID=614101 RepID=A0ABQ9G502_9NEOP|nr:hypothetical protein PR048_031351 [Dryococelus australis]
MEERQKKLAASNYGDVCKRLPFTGCEGATPDGLINEDGSVVLKRPASAEMLRPVSAILQRKMTFWIVGKDKEIAEIDTHHKYY